MKPYALYNKQGMYLDYVLLKDGDDVPENATPILPLDGMYKAKFTGSEWLETITEEELAALNQPTPPSNEEILGQQMTDLELRLFALEREKHV